MEVIMDSQNGLLFVLSGPSGVGKGTVCSALKKTDANVIYSVSATTRSPREGEIEGVNYFFKTKEQFQHMIENDELLEWAQYVDNYYGTPRAYVEEQMAMGNDVLLEIEVQGALQVKKKYPQGIFIFLMPPSLEELENRIVTRGTETESTIVSRMTMARHEIELMEHYDYIVVNDEVEKACERIQSIVVAEHCKKERRIHDYLHKLKEENE